MKKLRVTVEGKTYEVLVEVLDEGRPAGVVTPVASAPISVASAPIASAPVSVPAVASSAPKAGGPGAVVSPLAGKVVSIDVAVGQTVSEATQVATVEAMKMNTYVYASKPGRVAEVLVKAGDGVDEGSVLLRIE